MSIHSSNSFHYVTLRDPDLSAGLV